MARPAWPERSRSARSSRQLSRFYHSTNPDRVFGAHSHANVRVFAGLLEEYQHADTLRRHGLPIRSKLLFCGPPGCGKSITAEVFAHELGLPLIVARLDAIVSSF